MECLEAASAFMARMKIGGHIMTKRRATLGMFYIGATCVALTSGCKSRDSTAVDSTRQHLGNGADIKVGGMGHYCSILDTNGVTWDFRYTGSDPCGDAADETIQRAGLYSVNNENHIVVRCLTERGAFETRYYDLNLSNVQGVAALDKAKLDAQGKLGCIFTVAPREIAIFNSPFDLNVAYTGGNGTDFIQPNYFLSHPTNCQGYLFATQMNDRGQDRTCGAGTALDNHFGNDWGMAKGTPLYAVAPGVVFASREFTTTCCGSESNIQNEVYLEHRLVRDGWQNEPHSERYVERILSAYFHMDKRFVGDGQVIEDPMAFGPIATVGSTGCSSGPHLHWGPAKITNTSRAHVETVVLYPGPAGASSNIGEFGIDAYGWNGPFADPWAVSGMSAGVGALSINLWRNGQAPQRGNW